MNTDWYCDVDFDTFDISVSAIKDSNPATEASASSFGIIDLYYPGDFNSLKLQMSSQISPFTATITIDLVYVTLVNGLKKVVSTTFDIDFIRNTAPYFLDYFKAVPTFFVY